MYIPDKLIRAYLIFGGIFLLFDGLVYFLNIKLIDLTTNWAIQPLDYASFTNRVYGSFAWLTAVFVFLIQQDVQKYRQLIKFSAIWAVFHGSILFYTSLSVNFSQTFSLTPSVFLWLPNYNLLLILETVLLYLYASLVYFWQIQRHDK